MQNTYENLCKLDNANYENLCKLDNANNEDLYLVKDKATGFLAVKRSVDISLFELYKKLQEINHVNLMKIVDVWIEQEECVVVAEYISGETVAECLKREGRLSEEVVRKYIIMLCDGVQELHNHNIIHRDISPNNVMLTCDGNLKLCDYDISKIYDGTQNVDKQLKGTFGYAAPEQFGYALTDEQTDIYAIGMLGYTMLGGNGGNLKCHSGRLKRAIYRAISIDKKNRYKKVYQMKGEIEMSAHNTTGIFGKIIQNIPGFRSRTLWHMIVALCMYPLLFYLDLWLLGNCINNFITCLVFLVIPWIFYLDLFHVSRRLMKLEEGQQWFRIVVGIVIQMVGYFLGGVVPWLI